MSWILAYGILVHFPRLISGWLLITYQIDRLWTRFSEMIEDILLVAIDLDIRDFLERTGSYGSAQDFVQLYNRLVVYLK
ncbi:MAG: hypothetical protein RKO25_00180 [Candidatus Contendobacter sp.]|nr:hypothetical protein [Candidatus Contendobacter sp.]